ncbi:MAG: FAD-dependent thymidylate synthase [Candidatus Peribacteria bacterium]|nr:FAD-dependent thymidylate synthase [Candidatus Peribacteria bacterium]
MIDAEAEAMLQALHSRSVGGIKNHLQVLAEKGAENFMEKFYVGYGHKSIGDCGNVTLFIEGVSMLVAKAIQDTRLYSGQESSTRYVDFSKQLFIDPSHSAAGEALLEEERAFYLSLLPVLQQHLLALFPREEDQAESVYMKAISAKAFDIARGFLPAGASTNLAWHTNLRQLSDRLLYLRHHPLAEVREVAEAIETAMIEKYPHSFSGKRYEETETYLETVMQAYYFHQDIPEFHVVSDTIHTEQLKEIAITLFTERPNAKTELPFRVNNLGTITFQFLLDFGSFH